MKRQRGVVMYKGRLLWALGGAFLQLLLGVSLASPVYTMVDGNSSVSINTADPIGMYSWTVDGQNQLNQQTFAYALGGSGPASTIDSLGTPTVTQSAPSTLSTLYTGSQFSIQVFYSLVGGAAGTGTSDLSEQIRVQNLTGGDLTFRFFQYANFNIVGSARLGQNLKGFYNEALVTSSGSSVTEDVDTGISPGANYGEVGNPLTVLADVLSGGPLVYGGPSTNTAWALEWQRTIAAGGTLIISKDLNITGVVPEPSSFALLSIAAIACGAVRRYARKR